MADEATEEHGEVKKMLTHLSSLVAGGDKFLALIRENKPALLRKLTSNHIVARNPG